MSNLPRRSSSMTDLMSLGISSSKSKWVMVSLDAQTQALPRAASAGGAETKGPAKTADVHALAHQRMTRLRKVNPKSGGSDPSRAGTAPRSPLDNRSCGVMWGDRGSPSFGVRSSTPALHSPRSAHQPAGDRRWFHLAMCKGQVPALHAVSSQLLVKTAFGCKCPRKKPSAHWSPCRFCARLQAHLGCGPSALQLFGLSQARTNSLSVPPLAMLEGNAVDPPSACAHTTTWVST